MLRSEVLQIEKGTMVWCCVVCVAEGREREGERNTYPAVLLFSVMGNY